MADEQKTFIIPLRKEFQKVPDWRRTSKAVKATRNFLLHHLKVEEVSLGRYLNMELHSRGRKNPPHKIKVKVWKEGDKFKAELFDAPVEKPVVEEKKKGKIESKIEVKETKQEEKREQVKETLAAEKKEILEHEKVKAHAPHDSKKIQMEQEEKTKVKALTKKAGQQTHNAEVFSRSQKKTYTAKQKTGR